MASVNLALNRPTAASGSVAPYTPDKAVNGSLTQFSRWLSNTVPAWMSVDFGAPCWINRWVVKGMTAATPAPWKSPDYNMSDFKLQGSNDNTTWSDIDPVVNNTLNICDRTFTAVCCRYVRIYVTKGLKANTQYASLMELEVYSAPSANLTNLTVSSGALTPVFNKNIFTYSAPDVSYETSSIAMTPTVEDPQATIKINGVAATSGQPANVNLNVGSNAISVAVTAAGGSPVNTYTVTVVRKGSPYLTALSLSDVPFAFAKNTYSYNVNANYSTASTNISFTKEDSTATEVITVNGTALPAGQTKASLDVGNNTIAITVTAYGGVSQTYTMTVKRSSDVDLSNLQATTMSNAAIALTPSPFDRNIQIYSGSTPKATKIKIIATADDPNNVSITIAGITATSGTALAVSVTPGTTNSIDIIVASKLNGDTKTYTCNITVAG